jgi:hypothetical protein
MNRPEAKRLALECAKWLLNKAATADWGGSIVWDWCEAHGISSDEEISQIEDEVLSLIPDLLQQLDSARDAIEVLTEQIDRQRCEYETYWILTDDGSDD